MTFPYSANLGDRDPLEVLASTAAKIAALNPARYSTPWAPGKWTFGPIIAHLADCEVAFAFRLRQAAAEPNYTVQSFDQDLWANSYPTVDPAAALAVFLSVRAWLVPFLRALPPAVFEKSVNHPEFGAMKFRNIVEIVAGHDLNHLAQL